LERKEKKRTFFQIFFLFKSQKIFTASDSCRKDCHFDNLAKPFRLKEPLPKSQKIFTASDSYRKDRHFDNLSKTFPFKRTLCPKVRKFLPLPTFIGKIIASTI
jgi:hypothetical protein